MKNKIIAALCASASLLCAESVLTGDQAADWVRSSGKGSITEVEVDGAKAVEAKGNIRIRTKKMVEIDPAKTYRLSAQVRVAPGAEAGRFYMGLIPCDAKGRRIGPENVTNVGKSETQLANEVKVGDVVIVIKDGANWKDKGVFAIAFEVDESGKLADLPNRSVVSVKSVEKQEDGTAKVTLTGKMKKAYPAGTAVRQHMFGGMYMYSLAGNAPVPADWKTFSAVIKGEAAKGVSSKQWWKDTRKTSIVVLANYRGSEKNALLLKDVKLEEVSE